MKKISKVSGDMLSKIGKHGVGKSIIFGMYDIEIPKKLKNMKNESMEVAGKDVKKSEYRW